MTSIVCFKCISPYLCHHLSSLQTWAFWVYFQNCCADKILISKAAQDLLCSLTLLAINILWSGTRLWRNYKVRLWAEENALEPKEIFSQRETLGSYNALHCIKRFAHSVAPSSLALLWPSWKQKRVKKCFFMLIYNKLDTTCWNKPKQKGVLNVGCADLLMTLAHMTLALEKLVKANRNAHTQSLPASRDVSVNCAHRRRRLGQTDCPWSAIMLVLPQNCVIGKVVMAAEFLWLFFSPSQYHKGSFWLLTPLQGTLLPILCSAFSVYLRPFLQLSLFDC